MSVEESQKAKSGGNEEQNQNINSIGNPEVILSKNITTPEKVSTILSTFNFWQDIENFSKYLEKLYSAFLCYSNNGNSHNCLGKDCEIEIYFSEDIINIIADFELRTLLKKLIDIFIKIKQYHNLKISNQQINQEVLDNLIESFNLIYFSILRFLKKVDYASSFLLSRELIMESPLVEFFWNANDGWKVEKVSPNVINLTGYTQEEFYNGDIVFQSLIMPQERDKIKSEVNQNISQRKTNFEQEYRIVTKDGQIKNIYDKTIAIYDENGKIIMLYGFIFDNKDAFVTTYGLPNYNSLKRDLNNFDSSKEIGLVLIKIKNLDSITSLLGRSASEEVISQFTKKINGIKTNVRQIYQISGTEFAILTFNEDLIKGNEGDLQNIFSGEDYIQMLYQIINNFEISFDDFKITLSIAMGFGVGNSFEIFDNVQIALNKSKQKGNPIIYTPGLREQSEIEHQDYISWHRKIKKGIQDGSFVPYFQGIKDNKAEDGEPIQKFESLVRYIENDGSVVVPYKFMEHARKSNLLCDITKLMIEKVIETMSTHNGTFSINLTIEDLENENTVDFILDTLKNNSVDPKRFIIEILESESTSSSENAFENILLLKKHGIKIAIDDFGVGSSNFQRLLKLRPHFIKIDGFFIRDLPNSIEKLLIVKNIVDLAKIMGSQTIAEFVETEEIQQKVKDLGIDYSQGYLFSIPNGKVGGQ